MVQREWFWSGLTAMTSGNEMSGLLKRIAADPAQRVYVLMDGARFDDLPGMLAAEGLSHRSLYRNVQDAELIRSGPWLVDPYRDLDPAFNAWGGVPVNGSGPGMPEDAVAADTDVAMREAWPGEDEQSDVSAKSGNPVQEQQLKLIAGIAADLPAAVYWIGDAGLTEAKLWRHLRTLNMVLIPKGYGEDDPPPLEPGTETHDALMFRHGDGNVLAEVLPVLDAAQFSRVFGPAKALMFLAPDHPASDGSIVRRAVLPGDAPPAPPGMLRLSMEQMAGIEDVRLKRSQQRIVKYLRDVAPVQTRQMGDKEVVDRTALYLKEGRAFGVRTEAGLARWCYLQVITNGEMGRQKSVTDFVTKRNLGNNPGASAEERVEILMWMASAQARRMGQ
jgi:hypothetical protein